MEDEGENACRHYGIDGIVEMFSQMKEGGRMLLRGLYRGHCRSSHHRWVISVEW